MIRALLLAMALCAMAGCSSETIELQPSQWYCSKSAWVDITEDKPLGTGRAVLWRQVTVRRFVCVEYTRAPTKEG